MWLYNLSIEMWTFSTPLKNGLIKKKKKRLVLWFAIIKENMMEEPLYDF